MGTRSRERPRPMTRLSGLLIALLLALLAVALRVQEHHRAGRLIEGEDHAREVVASLTAASLDELATGSPHPGLFALLRHTPGLAPLPDLGDPPRESYARDDVYVYGLLTTARRADGDAPMVQGFVLRAWPVEFGVTGDLEYFATETGELWEGQNLLGRSGTGRGFPPPFGERPFTGRSGGTWWTIAPPDSAHR